MGEAFVNKFYAILRVLGGEGLNAIPTWMLASHVISHPACEIPQL